MVEFRILRGKSKAKSRMVTLAFRRSDLSLLSKLLGRVPWEEAPGERMGLAKLATFHGSSPQCSRMIHPHEQEIQ